MVSKEVMSFCDPYQEFELYLEQAKNEITRVFETGNLDFKPESSKNAAEAWSDDNACEKPKQNSQINEWEADNFLTHFDTIIASDIKELLIRYKLRQNDSLGEDSEIFNFNHEVPEDAIPSGDGTSEIPASLIVSELNGSLSTLNSSEPIEITLNDYHSVNAVTQTSPSLSQSSTNLTWASGSSSPCLTSTSEVDVIDEDGQSSSCSEDADQKTEAWTRRQQDLGSKSSSAPVLKKVITKVSRQTRSQSDRHLAEIEAAEACKWLRAAGFPQYAQMYEDMQFPVDVTAAQQDHPMLEPAVLHSLFRRLQALNRCAKVHQQRVAHIDDSEDEHCALSDNWTYQSDLRRWSRNCQNMQIPNIEEQSNKEWWCSNQNEGGDHLADSPKERLRRAASTKFRRRRDGLVISDSGSNVLDVLSKQLNNLNSEEDVHVSDTECNSKTSRRRKTRSLDKSDTLLPCSPHHTDRVVWQNITKTAQPTGESSLTLEEGGRSIGSLSCIQLLVLQKLALLKLTAHMEKYCPSHRTGWNWELPKFMRKMKTPIYREKLVFGVPLSVTLQRTGHALPKGIQEALRWLLQNAADQVGLFRKPGVRSRIQALKTMVETQGENLNFTDQQAYDVADMVKQYFRELPEALLTNKFSETFILIFQYIPPASRREAILCALLLMPDEHREVLQVLLNFLSSVAKNSTVNQMNDSNLAVCFAPSLFQYSQVTPVKQALGSPHPKELAENRAGHECLLYLIKNNESLFSIPKELLNQCKSSEIKESVVVHLFDLGAELSGGWREYMKECQNALLKEAREKGRGWIIVPCNHSRVELAFKKVADGHPLRLWKVSADIEAPPSEVLRKILRERHVWDDELQSTKIVSQMDKQCEIFHYVRRNMVFLPYEDYCVLRTWKTDLPRDACLIVETSIEFTDAINIPNCVRGIIFASRYLIEPCGSGRSRLLHLARTDTRGRMPEWHHKNFGHVCALHVANVQNSFRQMTSGPESKV